MILIKVTYSSSTPTIKVTYDVTDVTIVGQSSSPVYTSVSYAPGIQSLGMNVPTGFTVTPSQLTQSGTFTIDYANGYSLPTNAEQSDWDTAYDRSLTAASVSGTNTKTLTLTKQNGSTLTTSWNDFDTVGLTSVGLSMPTAFTVSNSPLTTNGTIGVTANGTGAQYIKGDGSLGTFPTTIDQSLTLIKEVYNETGATLTKGTVVYINGGHGNLPTVTKAVNTSDSTSAQTFGVVQSDITNMNNGYVVVIGNLNNIDTQSYLEGTQLYLSSTAGQWTSTKPYAPYHLVYVGIVVRSHPTQGIVSVKTQNGYEVDELHNCSAQNPNNNDGLFYNTSTSLWESKSIPTALGYTPVTNARTLSINGTTYDLSANRSWTISASAGYTISTKTNTYTENATSGDIVLLCDTTTTSFTINLPTAIGNNAKITIKKISASNTLTIDASGTETIDGGLTAQLKVNYASVTLVSNGSNWYII